MARILLVDDDVASRDLMARSLSADGHTVTLAENGAEALSQLSSGFDLVLSDVQMPEVDGVALATRALAAHPGLKVMLMSGLAAGFNSAAPIANRLAGTLTKPITPDALKAAVRQALAGG